MASFTYWRVLVDIFFPIAFILLVMLNIPAPRKIRRGIVIATDKVLSFPLLGNFQLLHVVLVLTGASFAETTRASYYLQQQRVSEMVETPNVVTGLLAKKWRAERNFWLSFFCFTLWCLLASFYRVQVHVLHLEDQLHGPLGSKAAAATRLPAGTDAKKGQLPSAPPLEAGEGTVEAKKAK